MFAPANQSAFTLTLDGEPSEFQVHGFMGDEFISLPFRFDLELVSEQSDQDLESLLHRQAFLSFDAHGHGVHGLVYRVAQGDSGRRLTRYQITLVPQLAYLEHSTHQRIFQKKTVPEIIAQVLEAQAIQSDAFAFQLSGNHPGTRRIRRGLIRPRKNTLIVAKHQQVLLRVVLEVIVNARFGT